MRGRGESGIPRIAASMWRLPVCCGAGLLEKEVGVDVGRVAGEFGRARHGSDDAIESAWREKKAALPRLYDAAKFRLHSVTDGEEQIDWDEGGRRRFRGWVRRVGAWRDAR